MHEALHRRVVSHVIEVSGWEIDAEDIWVACHEDGTVSFGPRTADGRRAIRQYVEYGEGVRPDRPTPVR